MGRNNALRLNPKFLFDCFLKTMLNGFGSKFVLQTPNKFGLNIAQQEVTAKCADKCIFYTKRKREEVELSGGQIPAAFQLLFKTQKRVLPFGVQILGCYFNFKIKKLFLQ